MGNLKEYLPSGQFTGIVLSLLIVGGLVFLASLYPEEGSLRYRSPGSELRAQNLEDLVKVSGETDSDGDGLRDWQEALWRTDPNTKDSDGDGTDDGDEIKAGRNPAIAGPNDVLPSEKALVWNSTSETPLSATDIFAREFLSEYAKTKSSDGKLSSTTESEIIARVLSSKEVIKPQRVYTEGELIISEDSSVATLKKYGNSMGEILKTDPYTGDDELTILARALDQESESELARLDPIIEVYRGMLTQMLALSTPRDAVGIHLSMINAVSKVGQSIESMRNVFTDPVTGLIAVGYYKDTLNNLLDAFSKAQLFFKGKGVIYTEGESGSYFVGSSQ